MLNVNLNLGVNAKLEECGLRGSRARESAAFEMRNGVVEGRVVASKSWRRHDMGQEEQEGSAESQDMGVMAKAQSPYTDVCSDKSFLLGSSAHTVVGMATRVESLVKCLARRVVWGDVEHKKRHFEGNGQWLVRKCCLPRSQWNCHGKRRGYRVAAQSSVGSKVCKVDMAAVGSAIAAHKVGDCIESEATAEDAEVEEGRS